MKVLTRLKEQIASMGPAFQKISHKASGLKGLSKPAQKETDGIKKNAPKTKNPGTDQKKTVQSSVQKTFEKQSNQAQKIKTSKKPDYMIEVRQLRKEYPVEDETVVALDSIDLNVRKGEICCIYGQSGSGKSTLLNLLAGLEKPTKGAVRINGEIITRMDENQLTDFRQRNTGFVFQSYNLLPNQTALENTAMPLLFMGMSEKERNARARSILKKVGLEKRMMHYPRQMSGGQQQRVGIARAFVNKPAVVFADEPTGNLDSKSSREIMEMICDFARRYHQTVLLVSHDPQTAQHADHIVTLLDGKIIKEEIKPLPEHKPAGKPDFRQVKQDSGPSRPKLDKQDDVQTHSETDKPGNKSIGKPSSLKPDQQEDNHITKENSLKHVPTAQKEKNACSAIEEPACGSTSESVQDQQENHSTTHSNEKEKDDNQKGKGESA